MSLREECALISTALTWLWATLWVATGVVVLGVDRWWGSEIAAEALSRIVLLWGGLTLGCCVWGYWRRLLRWYDLPAVALLPLIGPSVATLLQLSVPLTQEN